MTNYLICFHYFNPFPGPLPHMQLWFSIELKAYHNREKMKAKRTIFATVKHVVIFSNLLLCSAASSTFTNNCFTALIFFNGLESFTLLYIVDSFD